MIMLVRSSRFIIGSLKLRINGCLQIRRQAFCFSCAFHMRQRFGTKLDVYGCFDSQLNAQIDKKPQPNMHFAFKKHPQTPQITRFHKESHLVVIFRNAKTCRPSLHGFQNHPKSNKLDPFPSPLGDEVLKPRKHHKE